MHAHLKFDLKWALHFSTLVLTAVQSYFKP